MSLFRKTLIYLGIIVLSLGALTVVVHSQNTPANQQPQYNGSTPPGVTTLTMQNPQADCAAAGSAASPSVVACGSAAHGSFSCATNATGATCTVDTTAIGPNSEVFVQESDTTVTGTKVGVTCNTSTTVIPTSRFLASSVSGTSFTINLGTVSTNPACFVYNIIN